MLFKQYSTLNLFVLPVVLSEYAGHAQSNGLWKIGAGKDRFSPGSLLNSKATFRRAIGPLA